MTMIFEYQTKRQMKNMEYNHLDPETWKINCAFCNAEMKYTSSHSCRSAISKVAKGWSPKCGECKIKYRKPCGPPVKYSKNPNDWKIECGCGKIVEYTNRNAFAHACRKIDSGISFQCGSCASTGYQHTEETKEKMRGRETSDMEREKKRQANIRRYEKMTPEEREANKEKMRLVNQRTWAERSPERRKELIDNWHDIIRNLPEERKIEKNKKISTKVVDRMLVNGPYAGFRPAFNPATIPYIVDILNVRYETEFIHALSEKGEFKIYDKVEHRFYYADAYCPELNIWVEFDEKHHRSVTKQIQKDIIREERIVELLDCTFLRIPFTKNIFY